MSKPLFLISAPVDTYSGYGARSRDLIKAIIELDRYDVKILPQRWGNTPWNFISDHSETWGFLSSYFLNTPQLPKQPEIWAQVTIPSEFQPLGKYNIGFTAGIETTVCAPDWIEGVNRMNVTFVSSQHSKRVFEETTYQQKDERTGQVIKDIKLEKPVEVLMEGADLDTYMPKIVKDTSVIDLSHIKEDFCYLFVGHWLQGDVGEDRKNTGLLVKAFYETFKNKTKKPALILKTSGATNSYIDRDYLLKKIAAIRQTVNSANVPNVYLLHGDFTDEEMNELYNQPKVKAMVNLTKGEGFGRPLLEFSLVKKPIIASNWSGQVDFLSPEFCAMVGGQLTPVHPSAANQWLVQEGQWFSPDHAQIGFYLKDVYENHKNYSVNSVRQAFKSRTEFSFDKMKETIGVYFDKFIPEFPKEVALQLPKLKKIELPKLQKVETGEK
jgi:hypothetical protein